MNIPRITKALKRWSPHGLCSGVLVAQNGVRTRTEACAIGCLALEFLETPAGKKYLREASFTKKLFIHDQLTGRGMFGSNVDFADRLSEYYGLSASQIDQILDYNDNCLSNRDLMTTGKTLHRKLKGVILDLRKKYLAWIQRQLKS